MSHYPFPFFGSGEARYFELMSMVIMFRTRPNATQQAAIKASAPPLLRDGLTFSSRFLMVAPDGYIHPLISQAYDADPGDEDELNGRPIFAAESRVRRFNEDIERWLVAIHQTTPLTLAARGTDGEAGGTDFSSWHTWSMEKALPSVLPHFRKTIARPKGRARAAQVLEVVLWLARESAAPVPAEFIRWLQPELVLYDAICAGDPDAVQASLVSLDDDTIQSALRMLSFSPPERHAMRAVSAALRQVELGWGALLAAAVLDASDITTDPEIAQLLTARPAGRQPHDGFTLGAKIAGDTHKIPILEAGARLLDHDYLLQLYLYELTQNKDEPHPDLIDASMKRLHMPLLVINLTNIAYTLRRFEWGIEVAKKAEQQGGLQTWAFLNVALLYAGIGDAVQARAYAKRSAEAGDPSAPMIESAALVIEGRLDEAVAALTVQRDRGLRGFHEWKDDLIYAPLFERADYRALFR